MYMYGSATRSALYRVWSTIYHIQCTQTTTTYHLLMYEDTYLIFDLLWDLAASPLEDFSTAKNVK